MTTTTSITVRTSPATEYSPARAVVEVRLPDSGRLVDVDVYGPGSHFGEPKGPTVNWAAIGSQTIADTLAYSQLLAHAAVTAAGLAGPTGTEQ